VRRRAAREYSADTVNGVAIPGSDKVLASARRPRVAVASPQGPGAVCELRKERSEFGLR
jgi:hypothetical protein